MVSSTSFCTVPPSKPNNLILFDSGSKCVQLRWSTPIESGYPTFLYYEVTSVSSNGNGTIHQTAENVLNYTSLEQSASYQFSVVAVSINGNIVGRSPQSDPVRFSGPLVNKIVHIVVHYSPLLIQVLSLLATSILQVVQFQLVLKEQSISPL